MNTLIMPAAAARFNHVIAFDVSKASLSLHILPSGETLSLQNDGAAIRRLLKREQKRNCKQGLGSMLVICEATGGYEDAVLKTASELGLDCHRAHGSGVRAYAKFRGRHAKNDPIDAALIAGYGRDKPDLELYQPPRPEEAALRALMGRRTELKDMIQAETCRIEHASLKAVRVSLESHLAALKEQLALIEKEIRTLTRRDEAFNKRSRLMQTLAGIGAVASQTIQAFLPELGHPKRHRRGARRARPLRSRQREGARKETNFRGARPNPHLPLHGRSGRDPLSCPLPRICRKADPQGKALQGRGHRRHAKAHRHPERNDQKRPALETRSNRLNLNTVDRYKCRRFLRSRIGRNRPSGMTRL